MVKQFVNIKIITYLIFCFAVFYITDGSVFGEKFIMYLIIFSPIISLLISFFVVKKIEVSCELPKGEVSKSADLKMVINLENKSFLPAPFIDIVFLTPSLIKLGELGVKRISLAPNKSVTLESGLTAKYRGEAKIGLDSIKLWDFFHIFSFDILKFNPDIETTSCITIIPRVFNISTDSFNQFSKKIFIQDESGQESIAERNYNMSEPGYELREYQNGDKYNKINWKVSAKKDELFVRKDEITYSLKRFILLDPFIPRIWDNKIKNETYYSMEVENCLVETLLASANYCTLCNVQMRIWLFEEEWMPHEYWNYCHMEELISKMATYEFTRDRYIGNLERAFRIVSEEMLKSRASLSGFELIVITCMPDEMIYNSLALLNKINCTVKLVFIKNKDIVDYFFRKKFYQMNNVDESNKQGSFSDEQIVFQGKNLGEMLQRKVETYFIENIDEIRKVFM